MKNGRRNPDYLRIALVHDWLAGYGGGERVLEQMLHCFPEADLFSVTDFLSAADRRFLMGKKPKTTFIQKLPAARKYYRHYLPLMPLAVEQIDLSGYDLILSSSHAVAKGVLVGPDQVHISYVHSPMRYAWDLQHQYLRETGLNKGLMGWIVKWLLHKMRLWDLRTANGVDEFIANSAYISRRIMKTYRRRSTVVYPPVDLGSFPVCEEKEDFYLAASRMVPYKRMDLIVEAFSKLPDKKLVVIGAGPEMKKVKAKAGTNIEILGHQPTDMLRDYMQRACAFVFAAEEDFGIMPIEAQACGTPVIAFAKGAAVETICGLSAKSPTGVFFNQQTVHSLCTAIKEFEQHRAKILPQACRENAERFSPEVFKSKLLEIVKQTIDKSWLNRNASGGNSVEQS